MSDEIPDIFTPSGRNYLAHLNAMNRRLQEIIQKSLTDTTKVSQEDGSTGFLAQKISAGSGIEVKTKTENGSQRLEVSSLSVGDKADQSPKNAFLGSAAFVDIGSIQSNLWPVSVSSSLSVSASDSGKTFVVSGTATVNLPPAASVFGLEIPFSVTIKARKGATVTVARNGNDTIETESANKSLAANTALTFFAVGATEWETQ